MNQGKAIILFIFCPQVHAATGWPGAGTMNTARYYHTATLLPDGKVLIAAGYDGGTALTSMETFLRNQSFLNTWRPAITAGPDQKR